MYKGLCVLALLGAFLGIVGCNSSNTSGDAQKIDPAAEQRVGRRDATSNTKLSDKVREMSASPLARRSGREFLSGNKLYTNIQDDNSLVNKSLAAGYVIGVIDTLGVVGQEIDGIQAEFEKVDAGNPAVNLFTILTFRLKIMKTNSQPQGDNVTVGQVVDIVNRYLEEHPENRNLPAAILVWTAIAELSGAKLMDQ